MIGGLIILAVLVLLVAFLARNMMPPKGQPQGDADDLNSWSRHSGNYDHHTSGFDGGNGGSH